ncbi:MAG TPA: PP2C family protein-serine/threonine phosphatase [Terriglobales bacterium]|nr:PP2C family protein-serine/threonine phosphatase [Terriglobales bacterium]
MQGPSHNSFLRKLARLAPTSGLGRFTLYLLLLDLFVYGLGRLSAGRNGGALSVWVVLLTTALIVLGLILGMRWFRRRFMWRLRNRLIVTYTFIGVIPLVLVLMMAVIAGYLFSGQFATFLASSDLNSELQTLEAANSAMATELATVARVRGMPSSKDLLASQEFRPDEHMQTAEVVAWYRPPTKTGFAGEPGRGQQIELYAPGGQRRVGPLPPWLGANFEGIVRDETGLYLRAVSTVATGGASLTVLSSMPVDGALLERIASDIGEVAIYPGSLIHSRVLGDRPTTEISIDTDDKPKEARLPRISGGSLPPQSRRLDRKVTFFAPLPVVDWDTGEHARIALRATTRPSLLYSRLFQTMVEFGTAIWTLLIALAIVFAIIELVALAVGVGLTRTMTRSVAELYEATQHINRGDLKHRIEVTSQDQLAALEGSFNSMSESLEMLMAEQREKHRLENELAIAQEVQAQLFPKGTSDLESLEVHGVCRPARTVSGDYYDFLPYGPNRLGISVGDISGKGISAALLMATIHSAVRAYEFGRVPAMSAHLVVAGGSSGTPDHAFGPRAASNEEFSPAQVLTLLNRQLYRSTPAEKYATLFLGVYDGRSGTLTYSNAGHLPPIVLGHDGSLRRLDTPGLVIGLFDDQGYEERPIDLRPGDIFLAFSDGVTEPENEFGEFGEERLIEIVHGHRHLPLARISELVTSAVSEWIGPGEQPDDITLVLARAR